MAHAYAYVGATISVEDFDNAVVEVDWAARDGGSPLYDEWQVAPAEGDIVVAGVAIDWGWASEQSRD